MATAKELNADLAALGSGLVEDELPGVRVALDRTEMLPRLQDSLIGRGGAARVTACRLASAILLPGECLVVRYEIGAVDAAGHTSTMLVTGRVFSNPDQAAAYQTNKLLPLVAQVRSRDEVGALRTPVALIGSLGMVVYAYPLDGELPTLAAATDPDVVGPVMAELLAASGRTGVRIDECRAEPVHYNRRHRCMLRYDLASGAQPPVSLYGKVANDGSGARAPVVVAAVRGPLCEAGAAVPDCLGYRSDLQLAVFSEIPGVPRVAQLLKSRLRGEPPSGGLTLESAIEACGHIAARLHSSDLALGDVRPMPVELARLRADLGPMRRLAPDLSELLGRCLDMVEHRCHGGLQPPLRQCHGDFSYTQLLFDGTQAGLVDFDNFCRAEPALDLGQFLAYLRYAGSKAAGPVVGGVLPADHIERLAQRFTAAYVGSGGDRRALDRIQLYETTNLVRMAQHAWANLKSPRLQSIVDLLEQRLSRSTA